VVVVVLLIAGSFFMATNAYVRSNGAKREALLQAQLAECRTHVKPVPTTESIPMGCKCIPGDPLCSCP
jgi:hypothetical protein